MDEDGSFPPGLGFITSAARVFDHIPSGVLALFPRIFTAKIQSTLHVSSPFNTELRPSSEDAAAFCTPSSN